MFLPHRKKTDSIRMKREQKNLDYPLMMNLIRIYQCTPLVTDLFHYAFRKQMPIAVKRTKRVKRQPPGLFFVPIRGFC